MTGAENFFAKIRNSDEATKRKWLWIFTPVIMIIVVVGWLLYISNSVTSLDQNNDALAISKDEQNKSSFFTVIGKNVVALVNEIKNIINKTKVIMVEGNKFNFKLDNLESVKSQGFPK